MDNRWTILDSWYVKTGKSAYRKCLAVCICGTQKEVNYENIIKNKSRSCGCLHKEIIKGNSWGEKHGYRKQKDTKGIYHSWRAMKNRCNNLNHPDYKYYGAKGIKVDLNWKLFENFLKDMKNTWFEGATLDRIDNSKGYYKENCQWLTRKENTIKALNEYEHKRDWHGRYLCKL